MKLRLLPLVLVALSACVTTDYTGQDADAVKARYSYAGKCSVWLRSSQTGALYCSSPKIEWPSGVLGAPVAAPAPAAAPAAAGASAVVKGDAAAGETVFKTFCVACHQADGTGKMGEVQMAADFVADKTRLAKTDEELLTSIRDGKTGTVGSMPPWGAATTDQQRADALAYIRATFGDK